MIVLANGKGIMYQMEVKMSSVSLVGIMQNEEVNIRRCLDSIKELCTEIILVDGGSTDKTVEIAESYGAKVLHRKWDDNFAAQRNFGLQQATSDWLLFLDMDEEVAPECKEALKKLIDNSPKNIAYNVAIENLVDGGDKVMHSNFRLWARHPKAIFINEVHEALTVPPEYKQLGALGIKIIHYGYLNEQKVRKGTNARNLRILEKLLVEHPERCFMRYYYSQQLFIAGDYEQTLKDLTDKPIHETPIFTPLILVGICKIHSMKNNMEKMQELAELNVSTPDFYIELGGYFYNQKKYFDAVKMYEKAIEMRYRKDLASAYDSGSMTWKGYSGIGNCYIALQNPHKAIDNFKLALEYNEKNEQILKVLSSIYLQMQMLEDAEKYLKKLVDYYPTNKAYQVDLGNVYMNTGKQELAIPIFIENCDTEQILNLKSRLDLDSKVEASNMVNDHIMKNNLLKGAPYRASKEPQFTVIIPTILKTKQEVFQYTLDALHKNPLVDKIIIIDNTEDKKFKTSGYTFNSKMQMIDDKLQLPPNHSWNYGLSLCKTKYWLFVNDDVLMHSSIINDCKNVMEDNLSIGLLQVGTNVTQTVGDYISTLKPFDSAMQPTHYFIQGDNYMMGWWVVGRTENWKPIPEELKYFYGDNFCYRVNQMQGLKIGKIINKYIVHYTSTSVNALNIYKQGILEAEQKIFEKILKEGICGS